MYPYGCCRLQVVVSGSNGHFKDCHDNKTYDYRASAKCIVKGFFFKDNGSYMHLRHMADAVVCCP